MPEIFPIVSLRAFACCLSSTGRSRNWFAGIASLIPGETPKYEPVLSGPYLMGKFKSTVKA